MEVEVNKHFSNSHKLANIIDQEVSKERTIFILTQFNDPDAIQSARLKLALLAAKAPLSSKIIVLTSPVNEIPLNYRAEYKGFIKELEALNKKFAEIHKISDKFHVTSLNSEGNLEAGFHKLVRDESLRNLEQDISPLIFESDAPSPLPWFSRWIAKLSVYLKVKGFSKPPSFISFDHHGETSATKRIQYIEKISDFIFRQKPTTLALANSPKPPSALNGLLEVFGHSTQPNHEILQLFNRFLVNLDMAAITDVGFGTFLNHKEELSQQITDYPEGFQRVHKLAKDYPFMAPFLGFNRLSQINYPYSSLSFGLASQKGSVHKRTYKVRNSNSYKKREVNQQQTNLRKKMSDDPSKLAFVYQETIDRLVQLDQLVVGAAAIVYAAQSNKVSEDTLLKFSNSITSQKLSVLDDSEFLQLCTSFKTQLHSEIESFKNSQKTLGYLGPKVTFLDLNSSGKPALQALVDLTLENNITKQFFGGAVPLRNARQVIREAIANVFPGNTIDNYVVSMPIHQQNGNSKFIVLLKGEQTLMSKIADKINSFQGNRYSASVSQSSTIGGGTLASNKGIQSLFTAVSSALTYQELQELQLC
ncbi:MAG: hypothetical protein SFU25_03830 [Candidatus Caenarcaniphilales bacterium]|nr:hypothetical protein [Candidatus Caenarcaniphilales bacterium]